MFEVSTRLRCYGVAVLVVIGATLITLPLWPLINPNVYPLFLAAVMFSAWYGGLGPGLLSTVLSAVAIAYFFSTLPFSPSMGLGTIVRLNVFGLVALSISSLSAQMRLQKQQTEVSLLKLRASEERYRCIVETANEGIWLVDGQLRTDYVNQRLAEMLGYSVEEMLGRPIFDFMDSKARIVVERHIERPKRGIKEQFDFRYQRKDGSDLWAIVCSNLILNEQGEFSGAIAMLTDVTERKRAEEVLKRYQLLSEHSRDIVLFVRLDGQIIEANNAAVKAYGYDKVELLSLKIDDLRVPQTHALIAEQIQQADKQGILFETIHRRQDGSAFPVEVSAQSTVIGNEKIVLSIIRDITKRKGIEEALRKSEERYRAFIEQSSEGIWRFELDVPLSPECPEDEQIQHFYQYGYLAECNNVMAQMYGFDCAREIVGARLGDLIVRSEPNNIEYLRAFIRSGYRLNDAESHEVDKLGEPKYFLNNLVGIVENNFLVRAWGSQRDITERKRVLESSRQLALQVQEQANTLEAILSASVDHIWITDRAGRYKYVSAQGAKALGLKPSDLVGKTGRDLGLPSDIIEKFDAQREQVISTGVPLKIETAFSTASSGVRHYEYIITPLPNQDKTIEGVVVISRDTTERQQAQSALQETNQKLEALIQASPLAIISLDTEGKVKMWSPAAQRIFGWTEQEVLGNPLPFVPEDKQEEARKLHEIKLQGKSLTGVELRRQTKNGSLIDVAVWGAPLHDIKGNISNTMSVIVDITDRKRMESERKQLLLSQQQRAIQLLGLADASLAINSAASIDAMLQATTEQARAIIGTHQAVTSLSVDTNWAQSINTVSLSDKYAAWHEYDEQPDGSGIYSLVCRMKHAMRMTQAELEAHPAWNKFGKAAGKHPPMRGWLAAPLTGRDGRNIGLIQLSDKFEGEFTLADEAMLVQLAQMASVAIENAHLYREAQEANRMKDEFLATLSHELRTPLNAMLGWTQLLRSRKFDESTVARALETIDRNTKALSQLIEDVLDVSRIITGKLRLNVRAIELVPVIEAAIETMRPAASAKDIRIESILDRSVGQVLGDANRLQQVVWNLLSNAVKFTPKGGRVEVRLERVGSLPGWQVESSNLQPSNPYAQITVTDTGMGIGADFLPYVFERFRQADGTTTRSHGGLGLGLAIVRHLVELQGGTVHAESQGEGKGAKFIVNLPLMAVCREASSDDLVQPTLRGEVPAIEAKVLEDLRVLVVDDEADARELIATMLGQYGAKVTTVATVSEALEALHRWKPNVLVSDIGMPQEDGYALIRQIRALDAEQGGRIPAVALTAYARAEDRAQALLSGFQLHVPKPVSPSELAAVVANLTGRTDKLRIS